MNIVKSTEAKMQATLRKFKENLEGLYTGRVSPKILAPVIVDNYGAKTLLPHLASLSLADPRTIRVDVWDPQLVKSVDRAIRESGLNFNPQVHGNSLLIPVPAPTTERREQQIKVIYTYLENTKITLREHRKNARNTATRSAEINEAQANSIDKKVQELLDRTINEAQIIASAKEAEIRDF